MAIRVDSWAIGRSAGCNARMGQVVVAASAGHAGHEVLAQALEAAAHARIDHTVADPDGHAADQ
jgi:hypothetical protein